MKYAPRLFVSTVVILLMSMAAFAQLKTPKIIDQPYFNVGSGQMMLNGEADYTKDKLYNARRTTDEAWKVFTDRSNVSLYDKNNLKTPIKQIAKLGTMAIVISESKNAVEVKMTLNGSEETGWIRKSECVIWSNPLVKFDSSVDIKAFIVNLNDTTLIREIKGDIQLKDFYQIYTSPLGSSVSNQQPIYQILFAYKYDDRSNRYLLSDTYKLSKSGQLLGWVNANRIRVWDTALALEPNWDEASRNERKASGGKLVASVYRTIPDARNHRDGKSVKHLLTRDPADKSLEDFADLIHPSGRYYGDVPRFPYFSETDGIIQCGAIGKCNASSIKFGGTNEMAFAQLKKELEKRKENRKNTNVVFLVDGTETMGKYVSKVIPQAADRIRNSIKPELKNTLKFGMLVYKDGKCKAPSSSFIIKTTELTPDFDLFKKRAQIRYTAKTDNDDYVAMHHGFYHALEDLGMGEFDNNIVIHIGRTADLTQSITRMGCDGTPNIDKGDLRLTLKKYRPSIIAIQAEWNKSNQAYKEFQADNSALMMDLSNSINRNESEKFLLYGEGESFLVEEVDMGDYIEFKNAPTLMRIYLPDRSQPTQKVLPDMVINNIESSFNACLDKNEQQIELLNMLYHDNSESDKAISEYNEVYYQTLQGIPTELLQLLAAKRVHLFDNAYTYTYHPQANYPLYRQVLFLKRSSIVAMKDLFKTIEDGGDNLDVEGMKGTLTSALERYAESVLNITLAEGATIDIKDLNKRLLGVQEEVMRGTETSILSGLSSFDEINDLSADEVRVLYKALRETGRKFNAEVSLKYPFTYHAGIGDVKTDPELEFYWIPIELLL